MANKCAQINDCLVSVEIQGEVYFDPDILRMRYSYFITKVYFVNLGLSNPVRLMFI